MNFFRKGETAMEIELVNRVINEIFKQKQQIIFTEKEISELKAVRKFKRGRLYKAKKPGISCRIEVYKDKGIRVNIYN